MTRRQAVSTMIQGTAADIHKLSLYRLLQEIAIGPLRGVRILLPIHNGVLFEIPEGSIKKAKKRIVEILEECPPGFNVPLPVRVGLGATWADCSK
jgi:DNA polymerase-1